MVKTYMTRLFTMLMLAMVSTGAWADVKVVFGEKGTEKFEGKGGTIEMTAQTKPDADDLVTVTFTVAPDEGYIISMPDIEVYETIDPNGTRADLPQVSTQRELDGEEPYNLSAKRDYYITVKSNLGLWIKTVNFRTKYRNTKRGTNSVYFIANNGGYTSPTGNNYYMVPAADPHQTNFHDAYYSSNYTLANGDPEKPFIATYKTNRDNNSIWEVFSSGDDGYFYIKHWLTGKYLIYEPPYSDLPNRKSVHLQTANTPGENAKFDIASNGSIRPISLTSGNRFLNPAANNSDNYFGSGGDRNSAGLVGVWKESTGNSIWHLEETVEPPSFTINADGTVEMSSASGTTIRFTTDSSTPTASNGTVYSSAITITNEMTTINAVAINSESKVSNVVTLPLQIYTYYIVNRAGDVAIQHTSLKQAVGKVLNSYLDIPSAIRSPYLDGETIAFYTFSGDYLAANLTDENKITETPDADANIYVTYTTDHLLDKFLKLRGARAFNIKVNNEYIYDNNGTLAFESTDANKASKNHLWYFTGNDPYAVQVKNADTGKYLVFSTAPTFSLSDTPANFILMSGSTSGDGTTYDVVRLREATGNTTDNSAEISVYSINFTSSYYLIDKAGKLIAGPIESTSSELSLPDEWKSPLVSTYHYYTTSGYDNSTDTYTPTDEITNLVNTGDIYVTYDVSNAIDLTGTKTYLLKFLHGVDFYQESDNDIMTIKKTAVYPYNNGDFNLYVNDSEKWIDQLTKGASTRTRWLWHIISNHNGNNLTGDDIDPYHVIFESEQNQKIKVSDDNFINGRAYLRTYKPTDYESVVTGAITKHTQVAATDVPTEYMILGTSISNMTLMTFGKIDNSREKVTSFEMYWKNNPTANYVLEAAGVDQVTGGEDASLTSEQQTTLEAANESENGKKKGQWHTYNSWGYSKPWDKRSDNTTNQQLIYAKHWFETISMGNGEFTVEEVQLTPQVILLDQHGWEIMRTPLYNNYGTESQTLNNLGLGKYNSPMVEKYYWYPTATKKTGYHKYTINGSPVHESSSLSDTPDEGITDFYVTYDVKPLYASSYTGAATADATAATPFLLKQGGSYATTADGTSITAEARPESLEDVTDNMQWYLKPNFDIDREMGYKYAGEVGAQDGAKSKAATEEDNFNEGRNGFDPYNVQIQSVKYPLRYFTTNTSGSKLDGGAWTGTSSTVNLQNMTTTNRQTATGYDQTTLNITNATFMVVADANGNMRLMPRFDHSKVMQSFGSLETQAAPASASDEGMGAQSLDTEMMVIPRLIHSTAEILQMNGHYLLASDFSCSASVGTSSAPFKGTIDGQLVPITGTWDKPLFNYAEDATIKNVIIGSTSINITDADTNVGAIAANAKGETRIYNCGILDGSVSGKKYVGGLVGLLDHKGEANKGSRVINCFSYANVSGGTDVGGIVGYNNYASKASDIRTMVMNCMFYGDITDIPASGMNVSPIYGGSIIDNAKSNSNNGLNNYNYYRYESNYSKNNKITNDKYNCALAAEDKYLIHFEFYRLLLNSNKKLAAYYASRTSTNTTVNPSDMAKWVLESADKNISKPKPYPILKQQGEYYSIINYDDEHITDLTSSLINGKPSETDRNKGGKLGSLTINISDNNSSDDKGYRSGSYITTPSKEVPITDKDFSKFNYNYYKVRLPYYNEVGKDNYKDGKVVTGWIITSMTGATQATPGEDITYNTDGTIKDIPYNFADRTCTKDEKGDYRVFSQGAYFDVPIGVSDITIKPYWANAAFISDKNLDKTYTSGFGAGADVAGSQYTSSDTPYEINGINIKVRNDFTTALSDITTKGSSVYDNAIVLVGNVHQGAVPYNTKTVPFTIMSADFDNDNEPDYSLIYHHIDRVAVSPIRFDFINILGTSMAQKPNGSSKMCGIGIFKPYGWFEVTNTSLISFGQIEYDFNEKSSAPLILLGGEVLQIVSNNSNNNGVANCTNNTKYIHIGSNVWFKEFNNGIHSDKQNGTPHRPISVTGGRYEKFYLSGIYQPTIKYNFFSDDAECYINGGSFGEVAGAGQEKIDGNVNWIIDYADIDNFYGGGINAANAITGDINVNIKNSHVDVYCGGPKFGNMGGVNTPANTDDDKTVTTNAEGCVFRRYFGAGYGGASYNRVIEKTAENNQPWSDWETSYTNYIGKYLSAKKGIATGFEYEYFIGSKGTIWGRFYVNYASFSKAITNNVNSTLKNCHITGDFYGGGSLGVVSGTASSTLDGCTVDGSVFGGGYSGSIPTIDVVSSGFTTNPGYNSKAGIFTPAVISGSDPYKWTKGTLTNDKTALGTVDEIDVIYTDQDLTNLGQVKNVDLTIKGNTYVKGDIHTYDEEGEIETSETVVGAGGVFGGGDASAVNGSTTVKIEATSTNGVTNVFGGGNKADVNVNTNVEMSGGLVTGNVYGGGKLGYVGIYTETPDANDGILDYWTSGGVCKVTITGGTIGTDNSAEELSGNVFGGGRGEAIRPASDEAPAGAFKCAKAMVYKTSVSISNGTVKGSVYGGGEVGRVENDTKVTIGLEGVTTSAPEIKGDVFGAGKGVHSHGYAALVRGNTEVTVQGNAKVGECVYGGGEIASVGRYKIADAAYVADHPKLEIGMPYSLANEGSGYCTVIVRDNAEVGPDGMKMNNTTTGKPDDTGYVFGAGKGILPYEGTNDTDNKPGRVKPDNSWEDYSGADKENAYLRFIETQGLVTQTDVTITGKAFIKGSVYGGSFNGHVQHDTHVTIAGGQIGCGKNTTEPYGDEVWAADYTPTTDLECASWEYDATSGAPYDSYAKYLKDGKYYYDEACTNYAEGGAPVAKDGHTYYGNVFGGGSGFLPYAPGKWHREAGSVGGNTYVNITGGHILTSVYGGNEQTDVGTYTDLTNTTPESGSNTGKCTINMVGGTVGVPRTHEQMRNHPVTCYVFGAGKGDQRIFFNTWTNVVNTEVNISGNARIYGSTFGGGEDGHVIGNAKTNIGGDVTITKADGTTEVKNYSNVIIGTRGTSGVDGNIFGGGRGFSETALTAGVVGGNVEVNISNGIMLGSVFGGGRLASVGTYFANPKDEYGQDNPLYGTMQPGDDHGNITVTISGGSIGAVDDDGNGNSVLRNSNFTIGDVFGGSKGSSNNARFGLAKNTTTTISGNAQINRSVFGGGEAGNVQGTVIVNIEGGTIGEDVYGGGALADSNTANWNATLNDGAGGWAEGMYNATTGKTTNTTTVNLTGGSIGGDAYGGGLGQKTGFNGGASDIEATVYGDITVNLGSIVTPATEQTPAVIGPATAFNISYDNSGTAEAPVQVIKSGRVFGTNNLNGSPKGNVTVNVYKTVKGNVDRTEEDPDNTKQANRNATDHTYQVAAVYGGGNLADYATAGKKATVIIHTCDVSVQDVYGGGNAAKVSETDVLVKGAWEIDHVFGGGNGKDKYKKGNEWITNAGADVLGNAKTLLIGGYIHEAYGGSNEKGTIEGDILFNTNAEDPTCDCALDLRKIVGSGKNAEVWGDIITVLGCQPEAPVDEYIGGADNADVHGNVELTITSGTFGKVFGGNNIGGVIEGHIKVNIEETGCRPIVIGQLYGCGNDAAYSVYGYKQENGELVPRTSMTDGTAANPPTTPYSGTQLYADPEVNVISCTSIGKVFGGGLGEHATVYGNPTVNINQIYGKAYSDANKTKYDAVATSLGEIGDVFGGGNEANVVGNTHVNIGTVPKVTLTSVHDNASTEIKENEANVIGANITGNVYGGGNKANVTGNTNVVIGKQSDTSVTP